MQREHYIPGSCLAVALRWARKRPPNQVLAPVLGVAALLALTPRPAAVAAGACVVAAAGAAVFPAAMPLLDADQRMVVTARLRRLAAACVLLQALLAAGALWLGAPAAVGTLAALTPVIIDLGTLIMRPAEARLVRRFRVKAEATLARVSPRVIAVTGSYGKTSTKNHIRDLLGGTFNVVASPASWNNTTGLSRTVNEHVGPDTEILVAEMGTYGLGEIREMCSWVKPEIGIITAIGPMHLERMKTLDTIAQAKSEILEGVRVAILNVDDERLAQIADSVRGAEVWRCGTQRQPGLDVSLERDDDIVTVRYQGTKVGSVAAGPAGGREEWRDRPGPVPGRRPRLDPVGPDHRGRRAVGKRPAGSLPVIASARCVAKNRGEILWKPRPAWGSSSAGRGQSTTYRY